MHEAIAVRPGHLRIHEGNDLAGIVECLTCCIDGGAQRAIAILVGGRHLNERDVERPWPAWLEKGGYVGQECWRVAGPPRIDGLPFARTDEDGVHIEVPLPARVQIGNWAKRQSRQDLNVLELLAAGDQCFDEWRRS